MELQQYVQGAIRTESKIQYAQVHDLFAFLAVLRAFIASAQLLDLYKKNMFYKKPINEEKWSAAKRLLEQGLSELGRGTYLPLTAVARDIVAADSRLLHSIIGLATETGELIEALLKQVTGEGALDIVNVQEEFGDLAWYQAIGVDAMQADWEQILETNLAKLKARYPEKFTSENAINRDLDKERDILEGKV